MLHHFHICVLNIQVWTYRCCNVRSFKFVDIPNLAPVSKDIDPQEYCMFPDNCKISKQRVDIIYKIYMNW